jgi:hypothetical protein
MSGHTPGPWGHVRAIQGHHGHYIETLSGSTVCDLYFLHGGAKHFDNAEFNARLISAAPDLLSSCQEMLNCLDSNRDQGEAKRARAAIKKALGDQ